MEQNKKTRRVFLKSGATLLLSVFMPSISMAAQILAVRVWPADDYTRVTLEGDVELKATQFLITDPLRLVIDIDGLELNSTLKEIIAKIQPNDPYIKQVRVAQNRPNVVRLVFDLKEKINPQVFQLKPVGDYKYRLVFDLYPESPIDPIAALIHKEQWLNDAPASATKPDDNPPVAKLDDKLTMQPTPILDKPNSANIDKSTDKATAQTMPQAALNANPENTFAPSNDLKNAPKLSRMVTIALDPGHGGEDPGAVGRGGSYEKNVVLAIA